MFSLHENQSKIFDDTHRFRVCCCGRRFGKTLLSVEEMFSLAFLKHNSNIAYCAPTFSLARDIAWDLLLKRCKDNIVSKNEARLEVIILCYDGKSTSKINLKSWDAVNSFLGQEFDLVILDEVSKYTGFRYGWEEIISPTLIARKGMVMFISTPNGKNHFWELFQKENEFLDWKSFKFSSFDNPFIPVEELERERTEKPVDIFNQEYLADFVTKAGLIYPEFKRELHLIKEIPKDEYIMYKIAGVDFGFTAPNAIVYIHISQRKNFYIVSEFYEKGGVTADLCHELSTKGITYIYPDPAEPDRILEMRRFGLPVKEVKKDINKGIDIVRTLFKQNRLFVLNKCINFLDEIQSYQWDVNKKDNFFDKPAPNQPDHLMDAFRYALFNYSPLEDRPFPNQSKGYFTKFVSKFSNGRGKNF